MYVCVPFAFVWLCRTVVDSCQVVMVSHSYTSLGFVLILMCLFKHAGILRGAGKQKIGAILNGVCYDIIGLPMGAALAFGRPNMGLMGECGCLGCCCVILLR